MSVLTWRQEQRVGWIERELLQYDIDLGNAESSYAFGTADAVVRQIDRLERELNAIYGLDREGA